MINKFAQAFMNEATLTQTENGHAAASTTNDAVLDLYGQVGGLRDQDFASRVWPLLEAAIRQDKLLTAKTIFYARDVRGGVGERDLFRKMLAVTALKHPEMIKPNLELIPFYGRWDDLYALVGTPLEKDAFSLMYRQFGDDLTNAKARKPVSLLGKWLKSCNASSEETRELGRLTARYFGLSERVYRHALTVLREQIKIVESQMSAKEWSEIDYEKIPSKAGLIYRNAFIKHDKERYAQYIRAVNSGEKKINTAVNTPQDIVHAYGSSPINVDETLEAMWTNLPDFVNSDENILVMADVSGSMTGRPMEVSIGLAMYFAQHNKGVFHNMFMTFESKPSFVSLENCYSLRDCICGTATASWGGSTNLNLACKEILRLGLKYGIPAKDMPTRLIIISDMEINAATLPYSDGQNLHADEMRELFKTYGYSVPQLIYWNVESRDNHFQTRSDTKGVMLASGSSPAVFDAVIKMEDLLITPRDAMLAVLNGERYSNIRIAE